MHLRTLMNLDEFLKENPDTLGCLTQKYLRFYWKAFPSPVHVLWKWDKNTDMTKYKLLSASSSSFPSSSTCNGCGGGAIPPNRSQHVDSLSLAIDFFFKTNSALTTNMAPLIFLRLPLMLRYVKLVVNNWKEDVFNIIFFKKKSN